MRGILKFNEPLAPFTSWHVGGPAEKYYQPADLEDLSQFLASLPEDEPITWLGLGSNVLISDAGIKGTVIHLLHSPSPGALRHPLPQAGEGNKDMHSQVAGEGNKDIECFPLAGEGIEDVGVFSKAEEKKENTELAEELTEGIQVIKSNDWSEGFSDKTKIIRAEAGITCAKLAKFCARHGLIGAEFFAGIPGTVGGALAMNAGAWGGETWQYVVKVQIINKRGERFYRQPSDYCIGYRRVVRKDLKVGDHLPEEWFVAGFFKFELGDAAVATQRIKALLRERKLKQPIGVFSCGSVFKNPTGDYAGRLIEASNLKGYKLGGAEISTKHGNFILNVGNATASDIYSLIQHVKRVIWEDHKVSLQTEVQYLGQFAEC